MNIKTIKRIFKWIVFSLVIQTAAMAYFNYIYIPGRGNVRTTMYEYNNSPASDWEIRLPREAQKTSVSHKGRYAAYLKGGKLSVLEPGKRKNKVIGENAGEISYFRWLPDRDMIIYALSLSEEDFNTIKIATYDVHSGEKDYYPDISKLPMGSEVDDIKLSPLTNIVYVKIKTGSSRFAIYRYDIMENLKLITTADSNIKMEATLYKDNVVYEYKNKIYVRNGEKGTKKELALTGEMYLIGVDSEDRIFAGELNTDRKIVKVYIGKADQDTNKAWEALAFKKPISPENIILTGSGSLYEHLREEKIIRVINDEENTLFYKENFIEMTDDYFITEVNTNLKLKLISFD